MATESRLYVRRAENGFVAVEYPPGGEARDHVFEAASGLADFVDNWALAAQAGEAGPAGARADSPAVPRCVLEYWDGPGEPPR